MVPFEEIVFVNNCLRFVPVTMLIYDWALTLDDEINLIWHRSAGLLKFGFLALRYGLVVPVALAVFGFVPASERAYRIETDINIAAMTCILAMVQVLLQARIYIMYNKSRTMLWTNAGLFIVEHSLLVFFCLHFGPRITPDGDPQSHRCRACSVFPRSFGLAYLAPLCYESYLVFLALRKSWLERDSARQLGRYSTLSLLVHGSLQYFVLIATGMAITLALFMAAPRYVLWVDLLTDATASIGGTRLILSVRRAFVDLSHDLTVQMTLLSDAEHECDMPLHSNGSTLL